MKKILLLLLMALGAEFCFAQDYYTGKTQVTAGGITYKVTYFSKYVIALDNINNTLDDETETYYKDGRKLEYNNYYKITTKPRAGSMERAFVETFTRAEYDRLRMIKEAPLTISLIIGPDGAIVELGFFFSTSSEMASFPPSKFALLEKNLKKYVTFELSDFAKGLKFVHRPNFVNFSRMSLVYP